MAAGGLRFKQQRFNAGSVSVSSVLLFVSIVGAFTPTVFYLAYGQSYDLQCSSFNHTNNGVMMTQCSWITGNISADPVFQKQLKPLLYACAGVLPLAYIVGLIFTLKTHSHLMIIDEVELEEETAGEGEEEGGGGGESHSGGGHGGHSAGWSKRVSLAVLVIATVLMGLTADVLVKALGPVLVELGISQTFAGLTFFAFITSVAEFANAIQFSLQNTIAISIDIAYNACVQVVLIQIPALIIFSSVLDNSGLTLIFPNLNVFAVICSVLTLTYISLDGKSNYFQGCVLIVVYVIFVFAFLFVPSQYQ